MFLCVKKSKSFWSSVKFLSIFTQPCKKEVGKKQNNLINVRAKISFKSI